jgi:ABC-2 type transport system permease protein
MIIQLIIFLLVFLSGVFFPVNNVPPWLAAISKVNPLTYGVNAIRQLFLSNEMAAAGRATGQGYTFSLTVFGHTMTMLENVLVVLVFGIALISIAAWVFGKQE